MRIALLALASVALLDCASASTDVLSDSDLVSRASAVFASRDTPADRILGLHHGMPVMVEARCSDVCPNYTVRIIHYLAEPGASCSKLGGDTVSIMVPVSITAQNRDFCIPHILYQRKLYTDHPYQR